MNSWLYINASANNLWLTHPGYKLRVCIPPNTRWPFLGWIKARLLENGFYLQPALVDRALSAAGEPSERDGTVE